MRRGWLVVVLLSACAQASTGKPGGKPDAGGGGDDSGGEDIDAFVPLVDAGPIMVTLSQSTDNVVATDKSLACASDPPAYTLENSWYRVFDLPAMGITTDLKVSDVQLGVQEASAGQNVQVKIGTYSGTTGGASLSVAQISTVNSTTLNIALETLATTIDAPITGTIPAGSKLVVEVFAPDHTGTTTYFYIGASAGTETAPGYLRTPGCMNAALVPTSMKSLNAASGALVMNVIGTHN